MEAVLHDCQISLQDCSDELDATQKERAQLQDERDQCKRELDEARETLQAVHESRQRLQDEKDKHRIREADWEKEKERLKAQIDELNNTHAPGGGGGSGGGPSASPPDSPGSSGGDGPPPPGGDIGNAALQEEVRKLREKVQSLRDELEKAQDELNSLRAYKTRIETQDIYKARIAACETENEKLERFGGTIDRGSRLYRTLKKVADFHDNGGPEPTAGEYAQIRVFENCIMERRRIMAQARTHPDPRGFMTPYLDKWDALAHASGCTLTLVAASPINPLNFADGELIGGSTLTVRMMATRLALDKLAPPQ